MAEDFGPFSNTTDFGEDDWRRLMRTISPDGLHGSYGSSTLAVTAAGDGLSINIATGFATVQGFLYNNTATLNKTNSANGGGSARPDRVVLRLDQTADSVVATVREGTVGGSAPPALTQVVTGQWDIPLARWSRAAGGGIGSLVDERQFLDRSGGLVMADAAVTAAVPLTALVPTPWVGQRVTLLATSTHKEYRWTGAFWERVDAAELASVSSTTSIAPNTTSWSTTTEIGDTFTAPATGRVKVTVSALCEPAAGTSCSFSARVTGPAGFDSTPSTDTADQAAVGGSDGVTRAMSTANWFVSGMTPGTVYTVTGLHKVSGGTGSINYRRIVVERA